MEIEYTKVNTSEITISIYVQLPSATKINKIVEMFNPSCVNPLVVVETGDGKYELIDGIHTMRALKKRNGGDNLDVDCKIYRGMHHEDVFNLYMLEHREDFPESKVSKRKIASVLAEAKIGSEEWVKLTNEQRTYLIDEEYSTLKNRRKEACNGIVKKGDSMKQNPCRYCAISVEYKGTHYEDISDARCPCDNLRAHREYLKSQRKFTEGEPITSLDTLLAEEWVKWHGKTTHIEVIKSLQMRIILDGLTRGAFSKAVRKESEVNNGNKE